MKSSQIEKVLHLVRRTGDRLVIMDNHGEEVFTLMTLGDYERLLDSGGWDGGRIEEMSEREMMEKVDRDIAYWRSLHADEPAAGYINPGPESSAESPDDCAEEIEEGLEDDFALYEETAEAMPVDVSPPLDGAVAEQSGPETSWFSADGREESLADVPDEGDEDRFLLEPV